MNLSPGWVRFLRDNGIEAVHWSTVGDPRASDAVIMAWAGDNGWIVFTHDLAFSALLAATEAAGPSAVQLRTQDITPQAVGPDVLRVLQQHGQALADGAIVTLDRATARVRVLPVRRGPP
jgi:predicted nuclease of predicted toxin-antitoxin system